MANEIIDTYLMQLNLLYQNLDFHENIFSLINVSYRKKINIVTIRNYTYTTIKLSDT